MASLNLSVNGPSIRNSYEAILNGPEPPSFPKEHARWAIFSVQAPLQNAFQNTGAKESVLKVDDMGSGDLQDLIDELNDGRIQFVFVKVKDPNSGLPKNVLIAWCGAGVPERTKGYFTSHLNAVSKILHSYHVQITARSTDDLTPELIRNKVADASGSKYSAGTESTSASSSAPSRPVPAKKPVVFTPTSSSSAFNPLIAARNRRLGNTDDDGWGDDAPPVTRTKLEKVESAYKPTKVNLAELTKNPSETTSAFGSRKFGSSSNDDTPSDVIGGSYKPVGKVDIAAIRAAAKNTGDDRPTIVKGAYEPVGKVDIAAIRAKARGGRDEEKAEVASAPVIASEHEQEQEEQPVAPVKSLAERSAAFSHNDQAERLYELPKPKVARKFGGGAATFAGTKAPTPGGFGFGGGSAPPKPPPIGSASRTFADQGGKTPAQIWAEKKAKAAGGSGLTPSAPSAPSAASSTTPLSSQKSGGEWKSGYKGKSWAPVHTSNFGHSEAGAVEEQKTGESTTHIDASAASPEPPSSPSGAGGVSALRDRFKGSQPIGQAPPSAPSIPKMHTGGVVHDDEDDVAPPPVPLASRPGAAGGFQLPGMPPRPPPVTAAEEDEEEPVRPESPVRIAVPVAREPSPPPAPKAAPLPKREPEPSPAPAPLPSRAPAAAAIAGAAAVATAVPVAAAIASHDEPEPEPETLGGGEASLGQRALIQYDYEKAEDNEIDLVEGEFVTHIEQVDEDWWMGTNAKGESGLFPSNYVELVDDDAAAGVGAAPAQDSGPAAASHPPVPPPADQDPEYEERAGEEKPQAIAQYDYEAGEDNELSFPEGAVITSIEFPDDDWWLGTYEGKMGLFPSNYVELQR